ncbi:hypothetical protein CDAR_596071 [Caerostris darwini]|uniref:Uncharacterized protein n=1 Tax=Caerostris darwini TaxID=1538125 RepID=A0AAV4WZL2_9ARAC|nr:hypothetical protein CDAR_596071 [Caerostris darwini]
MLKNLSVDSSVDRSVHAFTRTLLKWASICIPRERVKRYSTFWNSNPEDLKQKRDGAREKARKTGQKEDCIVLKKCQTVLKKATIDSKRTTYQSFLEKLNFRRDDIRAHNFDCIK